MLMIASTWFLRLFLSSSLLSVPFEPEFPFFGVEVFPFGRARDILELSAAAFLWSKRRLE